MGHDDKVGEFNRLLRMATDASFDCGAYDDVDGEQTLDDYKALVAKAEEAKSALRAFVFAPSADRANIEASTDKAVQAGAKEQQRLRPGHQSASSSERAIKACTDPRGHLFGNRCYYCGIERPSGTLTADGIRAAWREGLSDAEAAELALDALNAAPSAKLPQEGYPGIAHDFETMRSALVQIRDECFNGYAHDIAEAALNAAPGASIPDVLFDSYTVYKELRSSETSGLSIPAEAVAEVLDAAVRLIRRAEGRGA